MAKSKTPKDSDPEIDLLSQQLTSPKKKSPIEKNNWLSTGNTLLNLACSSNPYRGLFKGGFFWLVGDSESAKTWTAMNCLAEAARNTNFNDYRFIFDNAENGALMDISYYFGSAVAERLEPPRGTLDDPVNSTTVEEFYYYTDDAIKKKVPFIYILDSMDAISSEDEQDKFEERKTAHSKGKQTTGSFGTSKPKINSANMRVLVNRLQQTGSILIVISQTRDNIGFGAQFNPKTVSGGKALKFFSHLQIWTSSKGEIKKRVKGKDLAIGQTIVAKVKKNRASGKHRNIEFPVMNATGVDDVGACVDYLIEWGHWKEGDKSGIVAKEFNITMPRDQLLSHIENEKLVNQLRKIVGQHWLEIEQIAEGDRKPRYS